MLKVPEFSPENLTEWLRQVALAVNLLIDGRSNAIGDVTLMANQTTTIITDLRVGKDSRILLMPITANAAGTLTTTYVSAVGKQTFTITHTNNTQTDKTFKYAIIG